MQIHINYKDLPKSDALDQHIESQLDSSLGHLSDRLTRVEVHVGDESSVNKHTPGDKRCLMEARPAGLDPIVVEEHADDIFDAVKTAASKLKRAVGHKLDKHDSAH